MAIAKKVREITVALLCAQILLLGGCGQEANVAYRDNQTVITIWTNSVSDLEYLKAQADAYSQRNNQNIRLEVSLCSGNYEQAIEMADSLDELPDILYADMDQGSYYGFCREGMFLELSPYLEEGLAERLQDGICPEIDGSIYRIYSGADHGVLYYNRKIFERCGIQRPPETMAEMVETARKITTMLSGNGIYGYGQNMKDRKEAFDCSLMWIMARDWGIYEGYDYRRGRYDFTVYDTVVEQLGQLLSEECAIPGCEALSIDALRELFAQGKIAMYFADSREERVYKNLFPMEADNYAAAAIPKSGTAVCSGAVPVNFTGGWLVSSGSGNREEALTVLRELLYSVDFLEGYYGENAEVCLLWDRIDVAETDVAAKARYLPEAPHIINEDVVLAPGNNMYDVFYSVIYGDMEVKEGLQKLTENYNSAYSNGIRSGNCSRLYLPEYEPENPEKTGESYRQMVLRLYKANASTEN